MELKLGAINGNYLRDIIEVASTNTYEVKAAVAYATDIRLMFDWCWQNKIPLKFWGRLDDGVAVSIPVLKSFLDKKSPSYVCKLVEKHHAKVIWWRGHGLYIGSANLTQSAWYNNVEAGVFLKEEEISDEITSDIEMMFSKLDEKASPLTQELFSLLENRAKVLKRAREQTPNDKFWSDPSIRRWKGLSFLEKRKVSEIKKEQFLEEWYSTLQNLRKIGELVSKIENKPDWVPENSPSGTQADQFLHAYYYQKVMVGNKANFENMFIQNSKKPDDALQKAIKWWKSLPNAPEHEERMLNEYAPFLEVQLSKTNLMKTDSSQFTDICRMVHSIRDYSRRVQNSKVGLPSLGKSYTILEKTDALARTLWNAKTVTGRSTIEVIDYVLYGGHQDKVPERIWNAIEMPDYKIPGLGISALGELTGWAMPSVFPPRNGRTSKALRSLGFDVKLHVD